jgi:PAS domain S-box-containing protein
MPDRFRKLEELTESINRYSEVLEHMGVEALVVADYRGRIVDTSESLARLFGYEDDEMIGMELVEIMPERYRARHLAGIQRFIETGEQRVLGRIVSCLGLRKDGTEFPISFVIGTSHDRHRVYGLVRDATGAVEMLEP